MYIIQNAFKSITRNKLRNVLIGIIVLVIAVSACVALSIREAAETAKTDTLSNLTVTAQISYDRTTAMQDMRENIENGGSQEDIDNSDIPEKGFDRSKFDFTALGSTLTLDDYLNYTEALQDGDSYYYSGSLALNTTGNILPYGTEESSDDEAEESTAASSDNNMPDSERGGMGGKMEDFAIVDDPTVITQTGDFSITGYSSYDAMLTMFGTDGSYSISDGEMFDEDSSDLNCIISDELAIYNDFEVGDTITLCNPNYEDETYTLTICGIYTNSASSEESNNRFVMSDPANNIYISYEALAAITDESENAGNTAADDNGEETSAALTSTISFTYTFADVDNYNTFAEKVYELGLSEEYTVSSSDISAFESSLTPLETLSTTAMWFFIIVIAVGGVILITLNIFNLRERKYEVGVLTAIGMKKSRVSLQFLTEIFIVTFIAIIIGTAIGASVSVPVTNALLENQISSSQQSNDTLMENFGFKDIDAPDGNGQQLDNAGGKIDKTDRFAPSSGSAEYVDSVTSATNIFVILELVAVGLFLTIISSLAALISIMRYEPLKILSNRT